MNVGDEVFGRIQSAARSAAAKTGTGAPTQEYLIRHTLESFLHRLTRTTHAESFTSTRTPSVPTPRPSISSQSFTTSLP